MLVGRERECERVERLLDDARRGHSGALLVCGEAGIGKTALLEWAIERASDMRVARATGIESEAELEFSGLLEVCRPLFDHLSELPGRQADALRGVLGLGPAEAHDRFSIGAATLSLLAAAGDETPLLVVADDVQWLDRASADAILFAARRLAADRVAILFAARDPAEGGLEIPGIERLVLDGLEAEAASRLLAREHRLDDAVVERLRSATGGNPLALLELSRLLTPEQLAGAEPLPDPVPAGPVIERAFAGRVRDLPDGARTAFLVAALGTPCHVETAERALGALGVGAGALEALEDAGLIGVTDGMVVFPHPLLRSAAGAASRASERRAVHRALAEALPGGSERRAWHLAASALGPDESVAQALEDAADQALERSGYAAAASALERAARLSESDADRARRTYRAAEAGWLAGQTERALGLLDEALRPGIEPVLRAHVLHLRGRIELLCGNAHTAYATLAEAADIAEEADPAVAVDILADAAEACELAALPEHALRAAERARALCPRDGGPPDLLADLRLGIASMLNGRPREGEERLAAALSTFESSTILLSSPSHVAAAALAAAWLDRQAEALDLATRATALARESGALGLLPYSLELAAWVQARCGRWQQAYAAASEALPLTRERGQTAMTALELIHLTWIDAGRGDEEAARAHADEVRAIATANGLDVVVWWVDCAIGVLELGLGQLEEAAERLESVERTWPRERTTTATCRRARTSSRSTPGSAGRTTRPARSSGTSSTARGRALSGARPSSSAAAASSLPTTSSRSGSSPRSRATRPTIRSASRGRASCSASGCAVWDDAARRGASSGPPWTSSTSSGRDRGRSGREARSRRRGRSCGGAAMPQTPSSSRRRSSRSRSRSPRGSPTRRWAPRSSSRTRRSRPTSAASTARSASAPGPSSSTGSRRTSRPHSPDAAARVRKPRPGQTAASPRSHAAPRA